MRTVYHNIANQGTHNKDWMPLREVRTSHTACGNIKWYSHFGKYSSISSNDYMRKYTWVIIWLSHQIIWVMIWLSNSTHKYIHKRTEIIYLHKTLHVNFHSCIIHNSQTVKTVQMSTNWWLIEQKVVYPHSGILFTHEKDEVLMHATIWITLETLFNIKEARCIRPYMA